MRYLAGKIVLALAVCLTALPISRVFPAEPVTAPGAGDTTLSWAATPDNGLVSVNFQNADISAVLQVLGDITGKVVIPPSELTGKVTIMSLERVLPEVVVQVLQSALLTHGYTVVPVGNSLKIVPVADTKQTNVSVRVGAGPDFIADEDVVITQVIPLKYESAVKVKNDLQALVGKHGNIIANERTNTIVITDSSSNIKRLATIIGELDAALPAKIQVKTFTLNYGDAAKVAKILNDLSSKDAEAQIPAIRELAAEGEPVEVFGLIQASAEGETNSIVVATAPVNFPAVERLIKKLDVFPPQAMIEVVILDVTLNDDFTMGVEYGSATNPALTTEGIKADLSGNDHRESIFHSLLNLSTDAATRGFTYRILNDKETVNVLGFILNTQENSKVLSTPRILASNNQESIITVGQEIPIIESSVTDLVNNITTVNFKYEDVGLMLKVTPRISQDSFVNLKVHAELKDLSAQTIYNASVINKREADATVILPDGHTVVLGGLMRDNDTIIESKVPFLGDIPVLGYLFKKTKKSVLKTELLIFLTPRVIKNVADLEALSRDQKAKLDTIQDGTHAGNLKKSVKKLVSPAQPKAARK